MKLHWNMPKVYSSQDSAQALFHHHLPGRATLVLQFRKSLKQECEESVYGFGFGYF